MDDVMFLHNWASGSRAGSWSLRDQRLESDCANFRCTVGARALRLQPHHPHGWSGPERIKNSESSTTSCFVAFGTWRNQGKGGGGKLSSTIACLLLLRIFSCSSIKNLLRAGWVRSRYKTHVCRCRRLLSNVPPRTDCIQWLTGVAEATHVVARGCRHCVAAQQLCHDRFHLNHRQKLADTTFGTDAERRVFRRTSSLLQNNSQHGDRI